LSKYVRKKKEMKKKRDGMGFYLVAHLKKAHAPPHSLYPSTKAHSLIAAAVSYLPRSAAAPSSAPSPTRARHEGDGGGAQARALSDGGAVPGSAAASAAPPPASRQSPGALASVLRTPAGDPAYAPPSPLPPPLDRRRRTAPTGTLTASPSIAPATAHKGATGRQIGATGTPRRYGGRHTRRSRGVAVARARKTPRRYGDDMASV